jgi:hypothetical protein
MTDKPPTLEDVLRTLAASGEMTHLSLSPRAGEGPYGCVWIATLSPASRFGHGMATDPDPVQAIIRTTGNSGVKSVARKLRAASKTFGGKRLSVEMTEDDVPDFAGPA